MLHVREAGSRHKHYGLPPNTLDAVSVAAHFGISVGTLGIWRKKGLIPQPIMKVGRRLLWSNAVLDEATANMEAAATAHLRARGMEA